MCRGNVAVHVPKSFAISFSAGLMHANCSLSTQSSRLEGKNRTDTLTPPRQFVSGEHVHASML